MFKLADCPNKLHLNSKITTLAHNANGSEKRADWGEVGGGGVAIVILNNTA